jgi:hypothetical protein
LHCWECGIRTWRATSLRGNLAPLKLFARIADGLLKPESVSGGLTMKLRLREPDFNALPSHRAVAPDETSNLTL